jgi:hypothetical protein
MPLLDGAHQPEIGKNQTQPDQPEVNGKTEGHAGKGQQNRQHKMQGHVINRPDHMPESGCCQRIAVHPTL